MNAGVHVIWSEFSVVQILTQYYFGLRVKPVVITVLLNVRNHSDDREHDRDS